MGREILFRGKRLDDGAWVYGWYCKYSFSGWPLKDCIVPSEQAEDGYFEHIKVDPATVGQYTGLTDKNGVKIFEGDVVRCIGGELFQGCYELDEKITVEDITDGICIFLWEVESLEVVGNIHDNPELLEEKQ